MLSDKALPQEKMTALEAKVKELENGEDCTKRIEDDEEEQKVEVSLDEPRDDEREVPVEMSFLATPHPNVEQDRSST